MPKITKAFTDMTNRSRANLARAIAPTTPRLPGSTGDLGQASAPPLASQPLGQQGPSGTDLFRKASLTPTDRSKSSSIADRAALSLRGSLRGRPKLEPASANLDHLRITTRDYSTKQDGSGLSAAGISFLDKGKEANLIVMVDSGFGGGLTTAQLEGNIRQFGHYLCLPIGDKKKNSNINFTATMMAMPFLMALKDSTGRTDGRIADGVIIACNSASVNKDIGVEVFTKLVHQMAAKPDEYHVPAQMMTNAKNLSALLRAEPNYLKDRVKGVIDATTDQLADDVQTAFEAKDTHFVRIDSTNATANSRLYPQQMVQKVTEKLAEQGYRLSEGKSLGVKEADLKTVNVQGADYSVSHAVLHFEHGGGKPAKTLYLEGRGNPPWVPIIEKLEVEEKGARAVEDSQQASIRAAEMLSENHAIAAKIFSGAPDQSANCCTHYDAMTNDLKEFYGSTGEGGAWKGTVLSQSDVVKTLFNKMGGTDSGAMGHNLAITKGVRSDKSPRVDKAERDDAASFVAGITTQTREGVGKNSPSEVKFFNLPPTQQKAFEMLNQYMALNSSKPIGDDHGYGFQGSIDKSGNLIILDVTANAEGVAKQFKSTRSRSVDDLPPDVEARVDKLAKMFSKGERRGAEFLHAGHDGKGLTYATEHLKAVAERNLPLPSDEKEAVGIMSGFVVVDLDGNPVNGENDGPPGAALMAKFEIEKGNPVVMMTDEHAEASILSALRASGLATLTPKGENTDARARTSKDFTFNKSLTMSVARKGGSKEAMMDAALRANVRTLITIERPSPNREGDMANMRGQSISDYNADLSGIARELKTHDVYTISIGDGGNELGMGALHSTVSETRKPDNTEAVKGGAKIAATPDFKPDAIITPSVSNHGGLALAMSGAIAQGGLSRDVVKARLDRLVNTQVKILRGMVDDKMSVDGVFKDPAGEALSVDGRQFGTLDEARASSNVAIGSDEATHCHLFAQAIEAALPLR